MKVSRVLFCISSNQKNILQQIKTQFRVTLAEAPTYLNTLKRDQTTLLHRKFTDLNNWYTHLIGLDEVKVHQDKVVALQAKLLETQEKRRVIGRQLATTRQQSNRLQDELHKVKRHADPDRFLNLMKDETELLQIEHELAAVFQDYDQAERELFTAFTNAVRDSYEKQRAQLEYTKYFGLVLSIAGSFLVFCYSTMRKQDLKYFIDEKLDATQSLIPADLATILGETHQKWVQENRNDVEQLIANSEDAMRKLLKDNQKVIKQLVVMVQESGNSRQNANNNESEYQDDSLRRNLFKYSVIIVGFYLFLRILSIPDI